MSYLPELRGALVRAADRQTGAPRIPGHPHAHRSLAWPHRVLRAMPALVAVCVALAIAVAALTQLGARSRPRVHPATPPPSAAVPGRRSATLQSELSVLRRPQRASDLNSGQLRGYLREPQPPFFNQGPVIRHLVRRAVAAPWGGWIYLIPLKPPSVQSLMRGQPPMSRGEAERLTRRAAPGVAEEEQGGASVCCSTAAQIAARGELSVSGGQLPGRRTYSHVVLIVPDGVSTVRFTLMPGGGVSSGTPSAALIIVTARVHANVALVQLNRPCCTRVAYTWYAPNGHVIKAIGFHPQTPHTHSAAG
ncbi:MAG: hypothetical protein WBQ18_11315 [Solirubrobacteraceae bacterium]